MAAQLPTKNRQVIASSNRTMFMWVAAMSAVIGVSLVLCMFLTRQLIFKTQVTNELEHTLGTLRDSNKITPELMSNLRVRSTDAKLNALKAQPDDSGLQVILDALPADANTLALGASLQDKLLTGVEGVKLEALEASNVAGESSSSLASGVQVMPVTFTLSSGDVGQFSGVLQRLERSIRVVDIDSLTIQRSGGKSTMSVSAHAYFQPETVVKLDTKKCIPDKGCK